MGKKYNVYRKKFTSPRTGDIHYKWAVLETNPQDTDTSTFEKVGEIVSGDGEGRVALQMRVNKEFGDPNPKNESIGESVITILENILNNTNG